MYSGGGCSVPWADIISTVGDVPYPHNFHVQCPLPTILKVSNAVLDTSHGPQRILHGVLMKPVRDNLITPYNVFSTVGCEYSGTCSVSLEDIMIYVRSLSSLFQKGY